MAKKKVERTTITYSVPEKKSIIEGQKNGICVALQRDKTTVRAEGNRPEDFTAILSDADIAWVNFLVDDVSKDGVVVAKALGFSEDIIPALMSSEQYNYEDRDVELGVKIPAVLVNNLDVVVNPLIIVIRRGLILSIHGGGVTRLVRFSRYAETFMRKIAAREMWEDKLTILLWRIIDESNSKNFDHLRQIEEQADHLVQELMDPTTPRERLGPHIYKMKHALIVYLDALWLSFDLINNLRYGDADTLSDDPALLDRISALGYDVTNQISLSEHMSEVLASGLEVLQSIYNNQLQIFNNRLSLLVTWLTILGTAVLVPNTLATIFGIPAISEHFSWEIIYLVLIASTILSAGGAYWFIKRKGLIPKRVD